jgi:lactate permease
MPAMPWTQVYDPLGALLPSALLAALPIVVLLGLLASGRVAAPLAALAGLAAALLTAILAYVPEMMGQAYWPRVAQWVPTMLAAAGHGAAFGLLPIGWIVLNAIFLYTLTVETGQFEIVKHSVMSLSDDRRIQALLIAFSFGAFVEGAAGFGTPVAISAALLMGAGFRPLHAAGLALLANTSPVAFGALGTPILTLANVTRLGELDLSAMAGRQLPFFSLLVPAWLVWVMAGWRGVIGVWPALMVCGGSFALVQYLVSNYHGPWLVDVAGGLISLICLALFLRFWQPRYTWHFPEEAGAGAHQKSMPHLTYTRAQVAAAWMPWVLLSAFVFVWGLPQVKTALGSPSPDQRKAFQQRDGLIWPEPLLVMVKVPALHDRMVRDQPVVSHKHVEQAIYDLNWLSATGTGIFLAAMASALWLGIRPGRFLGTFARTIWRMRWPLVTISAMMAIGFVTRYSGMDASLGLAFTHTGWVYPLFAALLGWLGVALTGSDTSSNALFGSLQTITAGNLAQSGVLPLGDYQAKILLASANSTGGVMGKMIDAQSIVVASAATGQAGQEGAILRFVFWHSLALAILMGLLVLAQAYLWTGMIPVEFKQ